MLSQEYSDMCILVPALHQNVNLIHYSKRGQDSVTSNQELAQIHLHINNFGTGM